MENNNPLDSSKEILDCFLSGKFKRMDCPQCENTFLTKVYEMKCFDSGKKLSVKCAECKRLFTADTDHAAWKNYVVLEKQSLGLEYFLDAIQKHKLTNVPFARRVGVLDEEGQPLDPACIHLFTFEEPDYRIIYVMERLEHLDEADAAFFTEHVHDIDWMEQADRLKVWAYVAERYGAALAEDMRKLCLYYRENKKYLNWDLHGDNLMHRMTDGKIVVMDPFAPKMGDYMDE
ncbi:hypothetical protein [Thiothrix fructosivorans]|jgi:hypothetical protein|uniref:Uncharacterized protein n=1 Tax=Thiothrix fructosivorans TaxID=111770 RepID=A0A8B0SBC7_9GAMM|nr:hypothetical protein [Thiothrix fructosivorans]MBO0614390.1 hypothetical protein [Thiothrix fructosivorans]QTX09233.1 hypothetical protein J1836_011310 [Thiothrix fructosivorans]